MKNNDIRCEILGAGLRFWQVAEEMGISNSTLSVKLRKELTPENKETIRRVIKTLKQEVEHEHAG